MAPPAFVPGAPAPRGATALLPSAFTPAAVPRRARPLPLGRAARAPAVRCARPAAVVVAQLGSPSPATQIGRPKTSIKKDIGRVTQEPEAAQPDAEKGSAKAKPRRKTQADEIPMYKVILLGDEEYVESHVVTQVEKTCQIKKDEATRVFMEAQATGSSVVCVVCEEHAEFYAQQLKRQDIFAIVEKDE